MRARRRPAAVAARARGTGGGATWAPLGLALLAATLLQWPALTKPFFADDWLFLDQARLKSLPAALTSPDPIGNYFRPLGRVSWFWFVGRAGGESPLVFHVANLLLWLVSIALLWALARRLGGARVAAVSAGIFALTYAADVPVMWASGAQDLLALALALGGLLAAARGRIVTAALLLFAAPLAKESAAVALAPALLLARCPGERAATALGRCWPLIAATLAWAALALAVLSRRHDPGSALALSPWGPVAALAGVVRVALGLEWRAGGAPWIPPALPGGATLAALVLAGLGAALVPRAGTNRAGGPAPVGGAPARGAQARGTAASGAGTSNAADGPGVSPWKTVAVWIVAGALPVALVAPLWSSYYFLFAMAGVALAAALATRRAPAGVAAAVVLLAGFAAQQARALDEFATAPSSWGGQSHVSRFYLERGMAVTAQCVSDLRAAHATVPSGSRFFFFGVPAFAAVQVGDGPLVRGVYRDTTLRSYYGSAFRREVLGRGAVYTFTWDARERRLVDRTQEDALWFNLGIGYLLGGHPEAAVDAFEQDLASAQAPPLSRFALAIARTATGDTAGARADLLALRFALGRDAGRAGEGARRAFEAGDSVNALRFAQVAAALAPYDPVPHIVLSRLYAPHEERRAGAVLEARAAVAFAPGYAGAWRNWSLVQRQFGYYPEALGSLERYFELDPTAVREDAEAVRWREELKALMPGGVGAQRAMKGDIALP